MTIDISVLPRAEWQTYKTIQLEALRENPEAFGSKYADWVHATDEKWQERPNNPDTIIVVAKDGEKPVGLVGVHFEMSEKDDKEGHVWGMFVSRKYRGNGLGKKLLKRLLEEAREKTTISHLSLMVNPAQEPATNLYTSLGFKITGTKKWVLGDGNSYELLLMDVDLK